MFNFKRSKVLNNFRRIVQLANILCKLWFRGKIIGQESCEKTSWKVCYACKRESLKKDYSMQIYVHYARYTKEHTVILRFVYSEASLKSFKLFIILFTVHTFRFKFRDSLLYGRNWNLMNLLISTLQTRKNISCTFMYLSGMKNIQRLFLYVYNCKIEIASV